MPQVRFKRVLDNAVAPTYGTPRSAGFDLSTAEDIRLKPSGIALVRTGLVIETPPDHMLYITFRSSTPRKTGFTVLEGIVDEDYCGDDDELKLQVMNINPANDAFGPVRYRSLLPAGSRIAQGIFVPITRGAFVDVGAESMGSSRGGFGSTG